MAEPVTLQKIADRAGLSRMTVSRALRNAPEISKATRNRVLEIAKALSYTPDPMIQRLASHLANAHRRNEGQVIAWINAYEDHRPWEGEIPFFSMFQGAAERARKLGFRLEEFWLHAPGMTGEKLSRILHQRGIECLILPPLPRGGRRLTMDWRKFSAVAIGYTLRAPLLHRVGSHHLHGARESIRELYRRGYRRIGLCLSKDGDIRLDHSWLEALAYHQWRTSRKNWVKPLIDSAITDKRLIEWLRAEKPDCILGQFEWIPHAVRKADYRIPEDVAVSLFSVEYAEPKVAGLDQQHALIGETACDLVVGQHYRNEKGVPAHPHNLMIEGRWVDGNTVARKQRSPR